ncbi:MAG: hypothetical protein JJU18_10735 [Oceanicaulis sp.]|nr:hypothetical protein [Oceanicaulis sp.]
MSGIKAYLHDLQEQSGLSKTERVSVDQGAANQRAFERGMSDLRAGKQRSENPYPFETPYHEFWDQGWEIENAAVYK